MDTSKEYIKMCNNINIYHFLSKGDFMYPKGKIDWYDKYINSKGVEDEEDGEHFYPEVCCDDQMFSKKLQDSYIWLPRQDQLQGMYLQKGRKLGYNSPLEGAMIHSFNIWFAESSRMMNFGYSMEMLWLCFIMKEIYNKTWNGKKWIKE